MQIIPRNLNSQLPPRSSTHFVWHVRQKLRQVPTAASRKKITSPIQKKILDKCVLVGATRFELGTSCAQGRRPIQNKSSVFSVAAEKQQLSRDRSMWLAVCDCANVSVGWAQNWVHFLR